MPGKGDAPRRALPQGTLRIQNALGLALLAVVVTLAALSFPAPVRLFPHGPSTAAVLTSPLVWLPAVLVQAALIGHLLVIRRLRADGAGP